MIDDVPFDGEDSTAATENRSGDPPTDQGQDGVGGIEVFGAAPLVDDENPEEKRASSDLIAVAEQAEEDEAPAPASPEPSGEPEASAPSEPAASTPSEPLTPTPNAPQTSGQSEPAAPNPAAPHQPGPRHEDAPSHTVSGTLALLDGRLASIEDQLDSLSRMTGHLPPKLRTLGTKVEELAAPLADASTRSLMVDLFMVDDLSRAALARGDDPEAATRALGAVVKMLENLFEQRDVTTIPTDGLFDPKLHQAVDRLPVDDPAHEGQILEVYRQGFRSGSRVLRFAEVGVAHYQPEPVDPDHADAPPPATND